MVTVVGEVSTKVPAPLPLKGTELEAKAAGDTQTNARTAKTLGTKILMCEEKQVRPLIRLVRDD
jgi:hypothetical protein